MQTVEGAQKAKQTNLKNDPDYFRNIGRLGGAASNTGGFAYDGRTTLEKLLHYPKKGRVLARKAGAVGGRVSRRTKVTKED